METSYNGAYKWGAYVLNSLSVPLSALRSADHVRKKNCSNNPRCLYGLGEGKEVRNVRSAMVMISSRSSLPLRTVDAQLLCCVCLLLVIFSSVFPVLSLDEQAFYLLDR